METLNAEQVKSELEGLAKFRTCPEYIKSALALINSQEQRIKELTQAHEMLSESYDHLEKTKDELLSERARLTEENERLEKLCALRDQDNKDTQDLLYKAEAENERLRERVKAVEESAVRSFESQQDLYRKMVDALNRENHETKADTVRKMQEMLKAVAYQSNDWSHGEHPMVVEVEDIDQIAKEMLEV